MPDELKVLWGTETVTVPAGRQFMIGRGAEANLRLPANDKRVSRRHLMIEPTGSGWAAIDISANGTWTGGRRMHRIRLQQETQFNLGAADGPRITLIPNVSSFVTPPPTPLPVPAPVPAPAPYPLPDSPAPPAPPASVLPSPPLPAQSPVSAPAPFPGAEPTGLTDVAKVWGPPPQAAPPVSSPPVSSPPVTSPLSPVPASPVPGSPLPDELQTVLAQDHRPGAGPLLPPSGPVTGRPPMVPGGPGWPHALRPGRMLIGRARHSDIVVADLLASREHAELFIGRSGVQIADLGSANGTFVNGRRVERAMLSPGDLIAIGHHIFHATPTHLVEYLDAGDVTFEVASLSVEIGDARLLNDVSFKLPGGALLAVIGPSGAGKSTLMNALTGFRPATSGSVRYTGRDLYAEYDELRSRIGYVPQDDILHRTLTVRQALEYGAELRFPAETTKEDRQARIEAVLAELGLTGSGELGDEALAQQLGLPSAELAEPAEAGRGSLIDRQVATLSGGQRKRTSVALELLTQPTLLYLDEPTSGLDPGLDYEVMYALRRLANGGRTVVVVTHSIAQLDLCDYVLVLAKGGHVAYFGRPGDALPFLGAPSWSQAFRALGSTRGAAVLAQRYRSSELYLANRIVSPGARAAPPPLPPVRQQPVLSQLFTLSRRYLRVIASDKSYLRLLIAYPFVLGLVPRIIDPTHKLVPMPDGPNRGAPLVLLVLVLCGIFLGASSSVREIVKEREIYRRERGIGLSSVAYLGSKVGVLTLVITAQSVVFTAVGVGGRTAGEGVLSGFPLLEIMIAVALAAVTSAMMGLVISALVDNADKTMPLLVLLAMSQLVFTGAFLSVKKPGLEQLAYLAPARWGYAAVASVVDMIKVQMLGNKQMNPDGVVDPIWQHTAATYLTNLGAMAGIGVASIIATWLLLRRLDPRPAQRR